jgi:predicted RNase H-like HicB family nuclease
MIERISLSLITNMVYNHLNYPASIALLEEGGYLVEYPDLHGCMADGETIEQALKEGEDAVKSWIVTGQEFGDPIPINFFLNPIKETYAEKFTANS